MWRASGSAVAAASVSGRGTSAAAAAAAGPAPKVLVLAGPTAVGKTATSLELSALLGGGEVVSADSVQVYRRMDVGTGKLPAAQRRGVEHHLLDVLEPSEQYSAADFFAAARDKTQAILARAKVPLVVGGTGMWLRWYVHGGASTGPTTAASRAAAKARVQAALAGVEGEGKAADAERWEAATRLLAEAGDPETARGLHANDYFRLERALEILAVTGQPRAANNLDVSAPLDYDFRCYFLAPKERVDLYRSIDLRCEEMLLGGLLTEAQELLQTDGPGKTVASAIGYRQAADYLRRCAEEAAGDPDWEPTWADFRAFAEHFMASTRSFAQDQFTWFKKDPMYKWIFTDGDPAAAARAILAEFEKPAHEPEDVRPALVLTKEQQRRLKCYRPEFQRLSDAGAQAQVLAQVKGIVAELIAARAAEPRLT